MKIGIHAFFKFMASIIYAGVSTDYFCIANVVQTIQELTTLSIFIFTIYGQRRL